MNQNIQLGKLSEMSVGDDGTRFTVPATGDITDALRALGLYSPTLHAVKVDGEVFVSLSAMVPSPNVVLEASKRFDLLEEVASAREDEARAFLLCEKG